MEHRRELRHLRTPLPRTPRIGCRTGQHTLHLPHRQPLRLDSRSRPLRLPRNPPRAAGFAPLQGRAGPAARRREGPSRRLLHHPLADAANRRPGRRPDQLGADPPPQRTLENRRHIVDPPPEVRRRLVGHAPRHAGLDHGTPPRRNDRKRHPPHRLRRGKQHPGRAVRGMEPRLGELGREPAVRLRGALCRLRSGTHRPLRRREGGRTLDAQRDRRQHPRLRGKHGAGHASLRRTRRPHPQNGVCRRLPGRIPPPFAVRRAALPARRGAGGEAPHHARRPRTDQGDRHPPHVAQHDDPRRGPRHGVERLVGRQLRGVSLHASVRAAVERTDGLHAGNLRHLLRTGKKRSRPYPVERRQLPLRNQNHARPTNRQLGHHLLSLADGRRPDRELRGTSGLPLLPRLRRRLRLVRGAARRNRRLYCRGTTCRRPLLPRRRDQRRSPGHRTAARLSPSRRGLHGPDLRRRPRLPAADGLPDRGAEALRRRLPGEGVPPGGGWPRFFPPGGRFAADGSPVQTGAAVRNLPDRRSCRRKAVTRALLRPPSPPFRGRARKVPSTSG